MATDDNFIITKVDKNKKQYLPLLLIGDESEIMIDRYLDSGTLYVGLFNGKPIAVCVTLNLDPNTVEIKNLAVEEKYRRHGYGHRMLEYAESQHSNKKIILGWLLATNGKNCAWSNFINEGTRIYFGS